MGEEEKGAEDGSKEESDAKAKADGEKAAREAAKAEADKIPAVEEAKKTAVDMKVENDRREKILEEEKKVLDRKESLNALGGGSPAGQQEDKPKLTEEEKASRKRIKSVADVQGSAWGKQYE